MIRIGMDIGGTKIAIAALDDSGSLLAYQKVPSASIFSLRDNAVDALQVFLQEYVNESGFEWQQIKGIGIGVPSVLDSHTQEIVSTPNIPGFDRLPLGLLLSPKLGVPVFVENDVNLIAMGEHQYGRGKGYTEIACVYVGTGLGCGLILNNQLYTGADGAAAEFGHTIYDPFGRLCGCGAHGCYEMYISGVAFTYDAKEVFSAKEIEKFNAESSYGTYSLAQKLIEAARSGHPEARKRVENAFFILGLAVTNLVNTLNPALVILGGGILSGWPEGIETVKGTVFERARTVSKAHLEIDYPVLYDKAGLYGAASLVDARCT